MTVPRIALATTFLLASTLGGPPAAPGQTSPGQAPADQTPPGQTPAGQAPAPPTAADWRHDLEQIVRDIRLLHPDPFTKIGEKAFLRRVLALDEAIPSLTEEERLVAAMRLVASLGDGHTMLEPDHPRYAWWYPVRIHEFADGYFVVSAHESVADLAGAEVVEIAGRPIAEVADRARELIGADNPSARKERLWALHSAGLMKGLGYAPDGDLAVRVRLADGSVAERALRPSRTDHERYGTDDSTFEWQYRPEVFGLPFGADNEWVSGFEGLRAAAFATSDTTRPAHLTDRLPYGARALPSGDAYYVRMNYVTDTDFVPFVRGVMEEVDRRRPRHFVIDWRQNFGGDGSKLTAMTREFVKRADDPPWGAVYLLTGPKTFSAAVMALDAVLDHVPATVVGEPSAAGFNHFGDPAWRTYERTGTRLSVSTLWHQLSASNDLSELVPVDVPAPFSFADFAAGRDPAVDPIVRGEEMRSVPAIARADGGAAAAAAWRDREARFGELEWWAPPSEFALRNACDALIEEGRTAEGLETCRLNAEIHPDVWNVWYNLGAAQRAAGLMRERLGSYRCVMEIAPDNWNVPAIRRLLERPGNEGAELAPGCPAAR